ncbi:MAG: putative Ig domain-containing protein [Planctomycetota bacterium]
MDDKQRTKLLGIGLAVVVAVWAGRSTVSDWIFGPIRKLEKELQTATAENERLNDEDIQLTAAQRNLQDWRDNSLPSNIDDAQRLYREWLFELARQCGFSGSGFEVTPGSRSAQKEFSTISVDVKKAEVDLNGLARFLYLFDQAAMMHRISALKIDSPGAQGNPRLVVSFSAEGMSVSGSEDRRELLPRTPLAAHLTESATALKPTPSELFPTAEGFEPFWIRIDRELLKVEAITAEGWNVQRGFADTKPAAHTTNSPIELFPVAWDRREKTTSDYQTFISRSPFVIPSPPKTWAPKIAGVSDKTIRPGEEVKFTARAENANPELGEAVFSLKDAAEGMNIDPKSGEFLWKSPAELAPGKYTATVVMHQTAQPDTTFDNALTITIRQPNAAPKLELPKAAIVVLGREFSLQVKGTDDGPANALKFSLGSGAPEGLAIDAASGLIRWNPTRSFTPGRYDLTVKATDAGDTPQSASATVALDVQDDYASMTLLTGTVSRDDVWFAWLRNKGTGITARLKVGEFIRISDIDAEIDNITNRFVTFRDDAGLWKLELGQILRDRQLIEPAPKPPTEPATTSPVTAQPDPETTPADNPPTKPNESPAPAEPKPTDPQPAEPAPAPPNPAPPAPGAQSGT